MRSNSQINAELLEDTAPKDGTVEPLDIRDSATRRVHSTKIAHIICGNLEEGNPGGRNNTDIFIEKVKISDLNVGNFPFEDEADTFGNLQITTESNSPDNRKHGSFKDNQDISGIMISEFTMESDLIVALKSLSPPSENMLDVTYVIPGTRGFD